MRTFLSEHRPGPSPGTPSSAPGRSLFRLAGFEELANRVRPSARRPGLVENEPEIPAEPGGEAPVTPVTPEPAHP